MQMNAENGLSAVNRKENGEFCVRVMSLLPALLAYWPGCRLTRPSSQHVQHAFVGLTAFNPFQLKMLDMK